MEEWTQVINKDFTLKQQIYDSGISHIWGEDAKGAPFPIAATYGDRGLATWLFDQIAAHGFAGSLDGLQP
jgi:hypothetical protein